MEAMPGGLVPALLAFPEELTPPDREVAEPTEPCTHNHTTVLVLTSSSPIEVTACLYKRKLV